MLFRSGLLLPIYHASCKLTDTLVSQKQMPSLITSLAWVRRLRTWMGGRSSALPKEPQTKSKNSTKPCHSRSIASAGNFQRCLHGMEVLFIIGTVSFEVDWTSTKSITGGHLGMAATILRTFTRAWGTATVLVGVYILL